MRHFDLHPLLTTVTLIWLCFSMGTAAIRRTGLSVRIASFVAGTVGGNSNFSDASETLITHKDGIRALNMLMKHHFIDISVPDSLYIIKSTHK
jgi:Kef-type K+ transport system membrane component KefB